MDMKRHSFQYVYAYMHLYVYYVCIDSTKWKYQEARYSQNNDHSQQQIFFFFFYPGSNSPPHTYQASTWTAQLNPQPKHQLLNTALKGTRTLSGNDWCQGSGGVDIKFSWNIILYQKEKKYPWDDGGRTKEHKEP